MVQLILMAVLAVEVTKVIVMNVLMGVAVAVEVSMGVMVLEA